MVVRSLVCLYFCIDSCSCLLLVVVVSCDGHESW